MSGTAGLAEVIELIACESWDVLKHQAHALHIRLVTTLILQKDLRRTLAVLQDHGLLVCMGAQAHPSIAALTSLRPRHAGAHDANIHPPVPRKSGSVELGSRWKTTSFWRNRLVWCKTKQCHIIDIYWNTNKWSRNKCVSTDWIPT